MTAKVKKLISQDFIDVLDSLIITADSEEAELEMDRFIISQQPLIRFLIYRISKFPPEVQEKANFINFFIWKAFDEDIKKLNIKDIELLYSGNKSWLEKIIEVPHDNLVEVLKLEMLNVQQPYLLNWVLEEILEESREIKGINSEIQMELFLIFKTIIDTFDIAVNGGDYLK